MLVSVTSSTPSLRFRLPAQSAMGRKRDAVWAFFNDPVASGVRKVKRSSCKYCNDVVTATTTNLKSHVMRCTKVPADHGIIPPPAVLKARRHSMMKLGAGSTHTTHATNANLPLLQAIGTAAVSPTQKSSMDEALSSAIHRTCLPFDVFNHSAWAEFFAKLRPDYVLPSPHTIGSTLLDAEYATVMASCKAELAEASVAVLGIDAVSKSAANVIVHTPFPWFMHNLQASVHVESASAIAEKAESAIGRVKQFVGDDFRITGFISDASKGMQVVRGLLLERKAVVYAYGCSACPLNSFCRDILSRNPFRELVKKSVFVSKTVKLDAFLGSLFESICFEKLLSSLRVVLYSRAKWSSCYFMFSRLLKTKSILTLLPVRLLQDREERGIDSSYEIPSDFFAAVTSSSFWRSMEAAVNVLSPICNCIAALENDNATLSLSYAVFLYLTVRLSDPDDALGLPGQVAKELREKLLARWNRVYSTVHALTFFCDPFYCSLRARIAEKHGSRMLELGHGDIRMQCSNALRILAAGSAHQEAQLQSDFLDFASTPQPQLPALRSDLNRAPSVAWAEATEAYPALAPVLIELFRAPATSSGSRRSRDGGAANSNRRLYAAARAKIGADRVERQDAIAHNSQHIDRMKSEGGAPKSRVGGFEAVLAAYGTPEAGQLLAEYLQAQESCVRGDEIDEEEDMLRALDQAKTIESISENVLFSVEVDDDA